MAKSKETKESLLSRPASAQREKKGRGAVSSVLLAYLDRGEGLPRFSFCVFSEGKNGVLTCSRRLFFPLQLKFKRKGLFCLASVSMFCFGKPLPHVPSIEMSAAFSGCV